MEEETTFEQEELSQLSDKTKELLCQINGVWENMLQEPKGTYTSNFIPLPPNAMSYWRSLEKMEQLLVDLDSEGELSAPLFEFRHTAEKEGSYVRDFTFDSKRSKSQNENELSRLMTKANSQVKLDLYSILKLSQSVIHNNIDSNDDKKEELQKSSHS